jgi:hopanoid biosynthesis associated RND transporter like protein HpnN
MPVDAAHEAHDSIVPRILRLVTETVTRAPGLTLSLVVLIAIASGLYSAKFLTFKTDRADLIDPHADYQRRWINYTKVFSDAADMVVVVEADQPDEIRSVLDDLGARIESEPDYFRDVLYKVDQRGLVSKGLHFLSPPELEGLITWLESFGPILKGRWNLYSLNQVFTNLGPQVTRAANSGDARGAEEALRVGEGFAQSLASFLHDPRQFTSPWQSSMPLDTQTFSQASEVHYLLNDKGTMGFLKAQPVQKATGFDGSDKSVDRMEELLASVGWDHPQAKIGLTGIPSLERDEMRSSQNSMIWQAVISFGGVGLLLVVGFRGIKHPLLGQLMLAVGTALGFGFATASVGHLNILSVSFVTMLVGLGSDYAILYLSRYLELRHEGQPLRSALLETSRDVGPGILTAAATTSLAFFCAIFTDFLGVAELGVIAGGGILLCALTAFFVMPSSIMLVDRNTEPKLLPTPFQVNAVRKLTSRWPWAVTIASVALIASLSIFGFRVKYDYNLLHLQADGIPSVELQKRLVQEPNSRTLFAVAVANSPEAALALKEKFEALPEVHHVDEIASSLPKHSSDQTLLMVQGIHALLADLPAELPESGNVEPGLIRDRLEAFAKSLEGNPSPTAAKIRVDIGEAIDVLEQRSLEEQTVLLTSYQTGMKADLLARFRMLAATSNPQPVTMADLPAAMTSRFARPGHWLLQIHPEQEIWDIEPLEKFVDAVRQVDPEVTGIPLQNYEASQQIWMSYKRVALYALFAIYLVLVLDFLSLRDTLISVVGPLIGVGAITMVARGMGTPIGYEHLALAYVVMTAALVAVLDLEGLRDIVLALLPPLAGAILMLGTLGLIGVDLNPANLIILPLILGIGVDNGVHVLHDYRRQHGQRYMSSPSTINSLVLTSLTNMVGFGSMIIAPHRGLKSIGVVSTVGVGSCLFVSVVLLPAMMTLFSLMHAAPQTPYAGSRRRLTTLDQC